MHNTKTKIVKSPWSNEFYAFVRNAKATLTLCSPYIGHEPCLGLVSALSERDKPALPRIDITTNLCRDNLLSGATSADGLLRILKAFPETTITFLPSLHAKIYIADDHRAIVTSANMTGGGLNRNVEYGIDLNDINLVKHIATDVRAFSSLGTQMSFASLQVLSRVATELREVALVLEGTARRSLRQRFEQKLAEADVDLLRIRTAGRTAHAIFADAILYLLLQRGPLTTVALHQAIQTIHPDLCDDRIDRVIDGRHFGKLWKHGVRTAQVYLRRQGKIERFGQTWRVVR